MHIPGLIACALRQSVLRLVAVAGDDFDAVRKA